MRTPRPRTGAVDRDARAEMAACHNDRNTRADVRQACIEQRVALRIVEQKLFRIVGENADAVDTLIDHAAQHAALSFDVDIPRIGERRRRDRKHASEGLGGRYQM